MILLDTLIQMADPPESTMRLESTPTCAGQYATVAERRVRHVGDALQSMPPTLSSGVSA